MVCELGKCDPSTITFEIPEKEVEVKEMDQKKQCSKCGKEKPLEKFNRNASTPDGLEWYCKDCKKKAGQEYRDKKKRNGNGRKNRKKPLKHHFKKLLEDSPKRIDEALFLPGDAIKAIKRAVAKDIIKIIEEAFV
jgi:hypothetical protein